VSYLYEQRVGSILIEANGLDEANRIRQQIAAAIAEIPGVTLAQLGVSDLHHLWADTPRERIARRRIERAQR
jgi:hypothetical protein